MSNTKIWDSLGRTDPAHTKGFKRAGGFSGTAMKPIWIVKRMTEQFGPVGEGWGMHEPNFQVVPADKEVLVFCTVAVWHTSPQNVFYGVGGDKVVASRGNGSFNSDEAFKMAYTDAVNNALKYLGVGADIHMGLFEDQKYVQQIDNEFAEAEKKAAQPKKQPAHSALKQQVRGFVRELQGCGDGDELSAFLATPDAIKLVNEVRTNLPEWWSGSENMPAEFVPLADLISQRQRECAEASAEYLRG